MRHLFLIRIPVAVTAVAIAAGCVASRHELNTDSVGVIVEDLAEAGVEVAEMEMAADTIVRLTEQDFADVAEELGVDVASVKAVIEIEAGKSHQGFAAPGQPVMNFDLSMFRRFASKRGINLAKYGKSHPAVFNRAGRTQSAVYRRFKAAESINRHAAIEGTFWGMFQIGGFNWKKCGTKDIEEFAMLMSRSERDQLELFAKFIINSGLQKALQKKDWAAFARGYNGPGYARRGYHTRLAAAYKRYNTVKGEG